MFEVIKSTSKGGTFQADGGNQRGDSRIRDPKGEISLGAKELKQMYRFSLLSNGPFNCLLDSRFCFS